MHQVIVQPHLRLFVVHEYRNTVVCFLEKNIEYLYCRNLHEPSTAGSVLSQRFGLAIARGHVKNICEQIVSFFTSVVEMLSRVFHSQFVFGNLSSISHLNSVYRQNNSLRFIMCFFLAFLFVSVCRFSCGIRLFGIRFNRTDLVPELIHSVLDYLNSHL